MKKKLKFLSSTLAAITFSMCQIHPAQAMEKETQNTDSKFGEKHTLAENALWDKFERIQYRDNGRNLVLNKPITKEDVENIRLFSQGVMVCPGQEDVFISLVGATFEGGAIAAFKEMLEGSKTIRQLAFHHLVIDDILYLVPALEKNTSVQRLYFSWNGFSDDLIQDLAPLLKQVFMQNKVIYNFSFSEFDSAPITEAGYELLASSLVHEGRKPLQDLSFYPRKFTKEFKGKIIKMFPENVNLNYFK